MIAVVNTSSLVSRVAAVAMVDAVRSQVRSQFAPSWSRLPSPPMLFDDIGAVPPGVPTLLLVDDSDQADALGYHTEDTSGRVSGIVAAGPVLAAGGELLHGPLSVSSVLSHETLETHVDPWVDMWSQAPDGRLWAFEVGDPVQGDSYEIGGISVSNFVCPHFFDESAPHGSQLDWLRKLSAPFTLSPGGYAIVQQGGVVAQIGAERPPWKVSSRGVRRCQREAFRERAREGTRRREQQAEALKRAVAKGDVDESSGQP